MKSIKLLGFLATGLVLAASINVSTAAEPKLERDAQIIVSVNGDVLSQSRETLIDIQNNAINAISNNITTNFKVVERYSNTINGFMIDIPSSYVNSVRNLSGVKNVTYNKAIEVRTHEADGKPIQNAIRITEKTDNYSAETMGIPDNTKEGEGTLIAVLDTGAMIDATVNEVKHVTHAAFTDLDASVQVKETQQSIQAKIAAAEKFNGKKDSTHSTYHNRKVPFYYDYGGDTTSSSVGKPDYDVYSKYAEHGNHVASIAAGNDPLYKGIAPKAQLAIMKIFTVHIPKNSDDAASEGAYESAILAALEDCAVLKPDVINMSFGSTLDEIIEDGDPVFAAINTLKRQGSILSASAGNDGRNTWSGTAYQYWSTKTSESGYLSDYAYTEDTVSVASAHATKRYYESAMKLGNNTIEFKDQIVNTGTEETYSKEIKFTDLLAKPEYSDGMFTFIKIPGLGSEDDFKTLEEGAVTGKVAIIDRGEINFSVKIANAYKAGAIAVGVIDNDVSNTDFSFRMDLGGMQPDIPVFIILNRDKQYFDNATSNQFELIVNKLVNNPIANTISEFSSDGPTSGLKIKPEISTPGSSILGAVYFDENNEESDHAYDYFDGTSMSAPNFAGLVSVILSEHLNDQEYRDSLVARVMSTANLCNDLTGEIASVRKQGAGMANATKALNSTVYLDSSTKVGEKTGKAKVELGNSANMKKGIINISFSTINEGNEDVTYNYKTYVFRPKLAKNDNEKYVTIYDKDLVTTDVTLIGTAEGKITAKRGQNVAKLASYTIPKSEQTFLNNTFENGCYIEGYTVLEAQGKETLNIPFLGYYGDYLKESPVECFDFEKDPNEIYQSDIVNDFLNVNIGSTAFDFDYSSQWLTGYYESFDKVEISTWLTNENSLKSITDGNGNNLKSVCRNQFDNSVVKTVYAGNNGYSNTMIISQFVTRPVATNTLTITSKSTGKVILTDHMFDAFRGATEDEEGNEIAWPLTKTQICAGYFSAKYYADRAYTIIPLYDFTKNSDGTTTKGKNFPDGEYTVKMVYESLAGGTYTMTYNMVLDSTLPSVGSFEDNDSSTRIFYNEKNLSCVEVNGEKYQPTTNKSSGYVDVPKSEGTNKALIKAYDLTGGYTVSLTHLDDENHMVITNAYLRDNYDFTYTVADLTDDILIYSYKVTKNGSSQTLKDKVMITIKIPDKFAGLELIVSCTDKNGKGTLTYSTISNGYVTFEATKQYFTIATTGAKLPKAGGCGGSVIAESLIASSIGLAGLVTLIARVSRKHKED